MSESANSPGSRNPKRWIWVVLLQILILSGAWGAWVMHQQRIVRARELLTWRNIAIVYLESDKFPHAEEPLQEIIARLPADPLGVRNLVIGRLLGLSAHKLPDGSFDPYWFPPIDRLSQVEPNAPSTWVLAGLMNRVLDQNEGAAKNFERAVELAPDDVPIRFLLFEHVKKSNLIFHEDEAEKTRYHALATAQIDELVRRQPDNMFLLLEQTLDRIERQDSQSIEGLISLREALGPLNAELKRRTNSDLLAKVAKVLESAQAKRWKETLNGFRPIKNVLAPQEWVQTDLRRLQVNERTFILHDFLPGSLADIPPENAPAISIAFTRVADELPTIEGAVVDVEMADFDRDDRFDLWTLTDEAVEVFRQEKVGANWMSAARAELPPGQRGLLLADLDRDRLESEKPIPKDKRPPAPDPTAPARVDSCQPADVDAVAFGEAGLFVLRNDLQPDGSRVLAKVDQSEAFRASRNVDLALLADVDHDGDLDILAVSQGKLTIWRQVDQLQFETAADRLTIPDDLQISAMVCCDFDRDADLDVLISSKETAGMLENLRHGILRWRPFDGDLSSLKNAASLSVAEFDGNVSWDVLAAGSDGVTLVTTRTVAGTPTKALKQMKLAAASPNGTAAHALVWDYDNDTHPDIVAWTDSGVTVYRGGMDLQFETLPKLIGTTSDAPGVCLPFDVDADGDLDLLSASSKGLTLDRNDGGNKNKWLSVRAQGEDADKAGDVNHWAIGSTLELRSGASYQAQVVTSQVTHFGLGQTGEAEMLRAIWTNGIPQGVANVSLNQTLCRKHDPGGSCPYLYTWTGNKYEFFTDACWGAPLGLQLADGICARPRAWEYLLIPGDRLKPRNGRYSMQMTEELWEATYLDKVELIAVDHPADVQVFSNEKVGPAQIAQLKVHTVRQARLPVAARDKHGRDVLPLLSKVDGQYLRAFDNLVGQGITDEHFLEFDLGKLSTEGRPPKQITLFLTGWMFPTPTSFNMQLTQKSGQPVMHPPALWVPDAQGKWTEVRPFMGFPGGKTKTIAVDLSQAFLADDYRLRIVTSMEFYWDAAWFTADESPAEVKLTHLSVTGGDLHYRGYSAISYPANLGPQHYDYQEVDTAPKWVPMRGKFTRYGDVTELLTAEDDRYAVFGSGDEITLEFAMPAAPPHAGWTRDFLLYNNGFDKDCDLNVITSQTVEPMPFQKMTAYPYGTEESFPETSLHREYLEKFQTREMSQQAFWRRLQSTPN